MIAIDLTGRRALVTGSNSGRGTRNRAQAHGAATPRRNPANHLGA